MRLPSVAAVAVIACVTGGPASAQAPAAGADIRITRAAGRIDVDGHLTDEAWRTAAVKLGVENS